MLELILRLIVVGISPDSAWCLVPCTVGYSLCVLLEKAETGLRRAVS